MKTIRRNTQEGVRLLLFPDGQPHVTVLGVNDGDEVRLVHPIRSSLELIQLLEISNALDHLFAKKKELVIPYLLGARSDRVMVPGDSVDLEVVANLINLCNFERVNLFDVHSDVALRLIHRSKSHTNEKLVRAYTQPNAILICPDAGAEKKIAKYAEWNANLEDVVYCHKVRDLNNGKISLTVLNPERCANRNCVIIDDLCDGGATFLAIAAQILPKHLTLIVSHGVFSKGLSELKKRFDAIITTDSYSDEHLGDPFATTLNLNL